MYFRQKLLLIITFIFVIQFNTSTILAEDKISPTDYDYLESNFEFCNSNSGYLKYSKSEDNKKCWGKTISSKVYCYEHKKTCLSLINNKEKDKIGFSHEINIQKERLKALEENNRKNKFRLSSLKQEIKKARKDQQLAIKNSNKVIADDWKVIKEEGYNFCRIKLLSALSNLSLPDYKISRICGEQYINISSDNYCNAQRGDCNSKTYDLLKNKKWKLDTKVYGLKQDIDWLEHKISTYPKRYKQVELLIYDLEIKEKNRILKLAKNDEINSDERRLEIERLAEIERQKIREKKTQEIKKLHEEREIVLTQIKIDREIKLKKYEEEYGFRCEWLNWIEKETSEFDQCLERYAFEEREELRLKNEKIKLEEEKRLAEEERIQEIKKQEELAKLQREKEETLANERALQIEAKMNEINKLYGSTCLAMGLEMKSKEYAGCIVQMMVIQEEKEQNRIQNDIQMAEINLKQTSLEIQQAQLEESNRLMEQRMAKLENDIQKAEMAAIAAKRANERARLAAQQQAEYEAALIAEQNRLAKRRNNAAGMALLFGALSAVMEPQGVYKSPTQTFINSITQSNAFQPMSNYNPDLSGTVGNTNNYYQDPCELNLDPYQALSEFGSYTGTIKC